MISNETQLNQNNEISLPPATIVGYRENGLPIYNIAGGSVDVTNDSDDDSDDDSSDDDASDSEGGTGNASEAEAWTPPTREDWDKLMSAKSKADSQAAQRKRFLRDNGFDPKTGEKLNTTPSVNLDLDDDEDDTDTSPSKESVAQAERDRAKSKYEKQLNRALAVESEKTAQRVRTEMTTLMTAIPEALQEAGWNGKNIKRMLKLMDLDAVEVDSDGDVEGLVDQIDELKKDFPEFFKRTRMREAVKTVADSSAVGAGTKQAPASEEDQDWKTRLHRQLYGG